jgi:hypothetical protein
LKQQNLLAELDEFLNMSDTVRPDFPFGTRDARLRPLKTNHDSRAAAELIVVDRKYPAAARVHGIMSPNEGAEKLRRQTGHWT